MSTLQSIADQLAAQGRRTSEVWTFKVHRARSPFFGLFFLAFVALLSVEWLLRRRWGMV